MEQELRPMDVDFDKEGFSSEHHVAKETESDTVLRALDLLKPLTTETDLPEQSWELVAKYVVELEAANPESAQTVMDAAVNAGFGNKLQTFVDRARPTFVPETDESRQEELDDILSGSDTTSMDEEEDEEDLRQVA